jgi:hypothetical protein
MRDMTLKVTIFINTLLSIGLAVLGNFLVAGALSQGWWWVFGVLALGTAMLTVMASAGPPGSWSFSWRAALPVAYAGGAVALGLIARLGPAYQNERVTLLDTFSTTLALLITGLAALVGFVLAAGLRMVRLRTASLRAVLPLFVEYSLLASSLAFSVLALTSTLTYESPSADPVLTAPYTFCQKQLVDLQQQFAYAQERLHASLSGGTFGNTLGDEVDFPRQLDLAAAALVGKQKECAALGDRIQQVNLGAADTATSPGSRLPLQSLVFALTAGMCGLGALPELWSPGPPPQRPDHRSTATPKRVLLSGRSKLRNRPRRHGSSKLRH